jgi:hypothetical protein
MCYYCNKEGKVLSIQGGKRTKLGCLVQNLGTLMLKKNSFLREKKFGTAMSTVKNRNVFASISSISRTDRDISKIPTDLDSAG